MKVRIFPRNLTTDEKRLYFALRLDRKMPPRPSFLTLCIFHDDHAPSLSLDFREGRWYCHGACRTGGGMLRFEQRYSERMLGRSVTLRTALEQIANLLGRPDVL